MPDDSEFARDVASAVLTRMVADSGPSWTVLAVVPTEEATDPPTDPSGVFHIRITVGGQPGTSDAVAVYFTAGVPKVDAIVATAGQLQDHAIEVTGGAALPACPRHSHPLSARVLDGIAQWVCPKDSSHHREPILPGQRSE
jgi:hypothetical protein